MKKQFIATIAATAFSLSSTWSQTTAPPPPQITVSGSAEVKVAPDEIHLSVGVETRSDKLDDALQWSGTLGKWFDATRHEGVRVLGPAAAPIMRLKRDYRYHFVLKSPSRQQLNTTLRAMLVYAAQQKIPRTQLIVDVDALWLM